METAESGLADGLQLRNARAGRIVRSDANDIGFKFGEHDGSNTPRARELVEIMNVVALTKLTTNMWGDRWSKLSINCLANAIAGLSGPGSAEVRTDPLAGGRPPFLQDVMKHRHTEIECREST